MHELTSLCMMQHFVWHSFEIGQTPLADKPKVVVPGVQVIYDGALILPLLSTPWTEREAGLTIESLGGVFAPETHYFGAFEKQHYPEMEEVFGGPPSHVVDRVQFLPALLLVLNWVDFDAQQTCHLCHLSKDVSHLVSDFLIEGQQMGPKICLPDAWT